MARTWWIKQMGSVSEGASVWVCKKEPENHINDEFVQTIQVIAIESVRPLVEALEEIHKKLVPKIPRMDGKESWTPQQKFIDEIVTEALANLPESLRGEK